MTLIRQCDYCHKAIEPSTNPNDHPIQLWRECEESSALLGDFHPKCFDNIEVWLGLTLEDKKRQE